MKPGSKAKLTTELGPPERRIVCTIEDAIATRATII